MQHVISILLLTILIVVLAREKRHSTIVPLPSSRCFPYNGQDTLLVPLSRDHNNIFLMDLQVNSTWIKMAVDTGSSRILISGDDCVHCSKQGPVTSISYGSQRSNVQHELATIVLNTFRYQCNQHFESFQTSVPFASEKHCLTSQADVNVAMNFHGTSRYNIVGLNHRSVFLKSLMRFSPRAFSMHIRDLHDAQLLLYRPGLDCFVANHFLTMDGGLVQIQGLRLNDQAIEKGSARHVLVDTGSNALSVPSFLYQQMPPFGTLSILLRSVEGKSFRLRFPYDKKNRYNAQVVETAGNTHRIVVGVTFLVGYTVGGVHQGSINYVTLDRL